MFQLKFNGEKLYWSGVIIHLIFIIQTIFSFIKVITLKRSKYIHTYIHFLTIGSFQGGKVQMGGWVGGGGGAITAISLQSAPLKM